MKENKYQLNEILYFIHGQHVVKGIIDEIIMHYTQSNVIVKYIIRPYGLSDYVTIDENKIYKDITEAKDVVITALKKTYTKGNLIKNYNEAVKNNKEKFKKQLDDFDDVFKNAIENIESVSAKGYDELEMKYQEELTKTKNNEINNKEKKDV